IEKPLSTGVVSVNMTPMIDMVFNLLIFFILTSQFVKLEVETVVLPPSSTATTKDYTSFRNVVINVVNRDGAGEVIVFGKVMQLDELTDHLKGLKESAEGQQMNVILRADAEVPYEDVARVMLATGRAQIEGWWITAAIEQKEDAAKK
ncbi:MAG: biopolymer transporter ExbD, partial [Planctomycetota bacterium]|nr:biopolymer transporter ExbD [Planctomycetota bacterium]